MRPYEKANLTPAPTPQWRGVLNSLLSSGQGLGLKFVLLFFILLAACTPAEPIVPTAMPITSAWGIPQVLATVPSVYAPALMVDGKQRWLAWTQDREREQRHIAANEGDDSTILALKAWYPFGYQLLPAVNGDVHWLWLDRTQADTNRLRLQSALVNDERIAELDANALSPNAVYHFSAVSLEEGGALVVWSEGLIGAENLAMVRLDGAGRGPFRISLNMYGNYPVVSRTNEGVIWMFWLAEGGLWRGQIVGDVLQQVERLVDTPEIAIGERMENVQVAFDAKRAYVLWQLVTADGTPYVMMVSGGNDARSWSVPQQLTFSELPFNTQTGYNGGEAKATSTGRGVGVGWATMERGQHSPLPVAITVGDELAVLYLQNGEPIAVQRLLDVETLFSAPTIATDNDRHITVAWAQPVDMDGAALMMLSTQ